MREHDFNRVSKHASIHVIVMINYFFYFFLTVGVQLTYTYFE
jgi:hypothetical protein